MADSNVMSNSSLFHLKENVAATPHGRQD